MLVRRAQLTEREEEVELSDEEARAQSSRHPASRARPELVAAMTPNLQLTRAGLACAALGLVLAVAGVAVYPSLPSLSVSHAWAWGCVAGAAVLLAICSFQLTAWRRALASWRGEGDDDLAGVRRTSWLAHLFSYAVVVFTLWAGTAASLGAGTATPAALLLGLALLFAVLGQVLAGDQYLRESGHPGTIPGHLRRLSAEIQRRR